MGHNIYFVLCMLTFICICPFGAINPIIALVGVVISGLFFFVWLVKEGKEQEKNYKKMLDNFKK